MKSRKLANRKGKNAMSKRQVSERSVYNTQQRRWANELPQGFVMNKDDWDNELLDNLLEGFLVEELPWWSYDSPNMITLTGRTLGAVKTALWKVAGHYTERKHFADYYPLNRTDRSKIAYSYRDLALLSLATNKSGIDRQAYMPNWIDKILGRYNGCSNAVMHQLLQKRRGFHKLPDLGDFKAIAEQAHPLLSRYQTIVFEKEFPKK
jgi:hypothetical protein